MNGFAKGDRVRLTGYSMELLGLEPAMTPTVMGTVVALKRKWGHLEVKFDDGETRGMRPGDIELLSVVDRLAELA